MVDILCGTVSTASQIQGEGWRNGILGLCEAGCLRLGELCLLSLASWVLGNRVIFKARKHTGFELRYGAVVGTSIRGLDGLLGHC